MNLRAEIASLLVGRRPIPECLFLRPADAGRLEDGLRQLLQGGQSLALSSPQDAVLDHYAELLIHRLRADAPCPVEVCFPASTAALVGRFEEIVAGMPLRQALRERPDRPPARIWLVHDAGALAAAELQLLVRLVSSFPGAGVRVVMLFGPGLRSREGFASLGRRFATWDIEAPTAAQARALLALAQTQGLDAVVSELLSQVCTSWPLPAADPVPTAAPPSAPSPAGWRRWWRPPARLHHAPGPERAATPSIIGQSS